jgi:hypothetical protein
MCPGDLDASDLGEVAQAAGGCMPVHPNAPGVQQDRPAGPGAHGSVDGAAGGWRERDQHYLGALTAHPQHPVAAFLAEVGDVRAGGFGDPQAEQPEHGHRREVIRVGRLPGGGEQGLELQMRNPQGG